MYLCSNCQTTYSKWQGVCTTCGQWNTIEEAPESLSPVRKKGKSAVSAKIVTPVKLKDLDKLEKANKKVRSNEKVTNILEFDTAIGGKIISGQVILLSGAPGIGKSTLSLQITESLSKQGMNVLYVAGEESPLQIKHRADRLKLKLENVNFLAESNIKNIENYILTHKDDIDFIFIDSIQMMYDPNITSTSGSISQISETTNQIVNLSKGFGIATIIIGHITKSGNIAGPKILEHMVDTVLYFEGDKRFDIRMLRVEKNRFGSTDEVGIFRMSNDGLIEVHDTKELFDKNKVPASGSVYSLVLEGKRSVVVEVQALATKTYFSNPRRTTSGFDLNRLFILLAIIEKRLKINTGDFDVYVNITGGIKITDPGMDLAVIQAIISSLKDKSVPNTSIFFGEVGLTGEIRKVFMEEKRIKDASRLGFEKVVSSRSNKSIVDLKI